MATSNEFTEEENKELLLSRVKQLVFVDGVAGFECGRCERVLIRHYVANCGHKYCANCRRILTVSKGNCPLAHCKKPIESIDFQDIEFERKLYDLRAHCPNKSYGCPFISQLKDLGAHLKMCRDTRDNALPVLIQGNNVVDAVLRELSGKFDRLSADVKQIKEDTCKSLKDMETKMDNNFEKMKEENEKKMSEWSSKIKKLELLEQTRKEKEMAREMKWVETNDQLKLVIRTLNKDEEKKEEITSTVRALNVKFESLNRDLRVQNQTMQMLNDKTEVMNAAIEETKRYTDEKMSELNTKITKLEETTEENQLQIVQLNESTSVNNNNLELQKRLNLERCVQFRNPQMNMFTLVDDARNNFQPDFTWKINGIKRKTNQRPAEIDSKVFKWTNYPIQAYAKMKVTLGAGVWMWLCLEEHNEGKAIDLKLIPQVYYLLRDRTKANNPQHRCSTTYHPFASKFHYGFHFDSPLCPESSLADTTYNANDSIVIDIYVEPPTMAQNVISYDGTLDWAIDHYARRIQMTIEGLVLYHESPYFYTKTKGYRIQVRMYLGLHWYGELAAEVRFTAGEFDAELPSKFPHQTTITIFNRKEPQRNIAKTVIQDIETERYYSIRLRSDDEIKSLLENDTLFYNVTIKPSN